MAHSAQLFWGKPAFHALCCISVAFCVFACRSIVFLISLNTCCRLHVYYLVLALFQFLLTSHCCRMHETVFHEQSLIQQLASPTCMLFRFLNLSFIVCMHDHSLMPTLTITMHSRSHSLSVSHWWVWVALAQTLPHKDNIPQS